uniref:DVA-1 polyprotein n=1 Tax=Dictyocaulus viviparus TaxID=29172 RepID=DVA1_DICVI|nr:RecName: Full=DVA-1 polyprotein; AltName: Full=Allergen 1; AltName: Full=Antigen 1; AltName: Full=Nematode polyprotein allergen DVA-1; Short=NPA DVA-1; Contains: RecName: Full=DVA-1 unit A; Contains: RecName: Full=DVA-1 unit B; Contains: RecName: Full=DVA-1 unit C; Contains: RecName: Full=DVA-1 unit D; Contains: RecName: Full=DVA-1 unit E; Contains: RecName: Full=DVA-1 unit F; Contains: RecName: Full=DVA-1 unit G; Contains: RecName: Full=DVA-1 unit H; Contains: RecName: Full=DVA-1 unit I; Contai
MKSTSFITLLLLSYFIVEAHSSIFHWDDERLFKHDDTHSWLTDVQKAELETLKHQPIQLRDKTLEFYNQLPTNEKAIWDKFYTKYCVVWLKEVASDEEIGKLKELESEKNKEALLTSIYSFKDRLDEVDQRKVELWKETCDEYVTKGLSRKRRDSNKNFEEFIYWMTDEQKQSMNDMKTAGKSFNEIHKEGRKYFKALTIDKQSSLKEQFKDKCKKYFMQIANSDEVEKIKSLNDDEIRHVVKNAVARLNGEDKEFAVKMETLCEDVLAFKARKNDIDDKINRRLSWMTDEQKQVVKQLYADGRSQADIRAKIFEFLSSIDGPAGVAAKAQIQKECYKWMEEVATAEEIAALHELHEIDHDGCRRKVREFIGRLPEDRKLEVEKDLPFCEKIWYRDHGDHNSHKHGAHHHHRHLAVRRRRHLYAIEKFLDWLKPEQKHELEKIENSGAHFDDVIAEVKKFYGLLPEEKKIELKAKFKSQCYDWVKEVATSEEMNDIMKMHESKNHSDLMKRLTELENRLTEDQKHTIEHVREVCLGLWEVQNTNKQHKQSLEEAMDAYLSWMTDEDKEKVKAIYETSNRQTFYDEILKIMESSEDEVKAKATEKLEAACKHYGTNILGEENVDIIREMKKNGATFEEISNRVDELIEGITDSDRKEKAYRMSKLCKKIYSLGHSKQLQQYDFENVLQKYLTWLDDSQKNELRTMSDNKEKIYKKIIDYFDGTIGEVKEKAVEELQLACNHYIKSIVGEEKAMEIKQLKEEGKSSEEIAKKVEDVINQISDESIRSRADEALLVCKRIFGIVKRLRRDNSEIHSLEEAMERYLTWLSDDQKIVIKSIYDVNDRKVLYEKIMEFFDDAIGETKQKAAKELKDACKHYVKDLIGEENGNLLREMKENGASNEAIATKVEEMIEAITDETKRAQAMRASTSCRKVYGVVQRFRRDHHHEHNLDEALEKHFTWLNEEQKSQLKTIYESEDREALHKKVWEFFEAGAGLRASNASKKIYGVAKRFRRDHHHEHNLDEALEKYLTWLNEEQKSQMKTIYESGDREALYKKVLEFFEAATGEVKEKAAVELKSACRHYIKDYIGDEKAEKIKEMKESGVSTEEISKKVDEFIAMITDDEKKAKALRASSACKKIYGVAKRFRRDHHHEHNLEEALEKYLTWLNEEQKSQMKTIYESGDREALYKKVLEFFEAATGEVKEKAAVELKSACRHYIKDYIGDEKAEKIKEMKESGVSTEEISKKVDEFIAMITDDEKKAKALRASNACKKIYGVAKRLRRDHHHEHNLEEAMGKYLSWMSDEQQAQVKKIYGTGDRLATYNKVMELFESVPSDEKEKATSQLKAACRHYIKDFIGKDNLAVIKEMKESGATNEAIGEKIDEFIAGLDDEQKKAQAQRAASACKKIYGVKSRKRREHYEIDVDEAISKYLTWLNEEQKAEIKQLKEKDEKQTIGKKIMEFFELTSGDDKEKAREQLKAACKHYVKMYVGEEKAAELKKLKDSGISLEEMSKKVTETIETIEDEAVRAKARRIHSYCQRIFGITKARRHLAMKHHRFYDD